MAEQRHNLPSLNVLHSWDPSSCPNRILADCLIKKRPVFARLTKLKDEVKK